MLLSEGRPRTFRTRLNWQQRELEGLSMPRHNLLLISEKLVQTQIIGDELHLIEDKVFELRSLLRRGNKVTYHFYSCR